MSKPKPNVLLVVADHWPAALLGCAGHPSIQTPTLDQIAANGVRFSRAYSECPVCGPARRCIMTGTPPRVHGDRTFSMPPMPNIPTLAQTFRDAGYQAYGVGKIHVHPQRNRIGFDDVVLDEEGRSEYGLLDDYEIFLGDQGYAGRQFTHGMSNNEYTFRSWHLPEHLHTTNWATDQILRTIRRRDPTRPGFWYLGYRHPHPPLVPPQCYLDLYRDINPGAPFHGEWIGDERELPATVREMRQKWPRNSTHLIPAIRRAFYALCTHVDHQLRLVIGTLRQEGILDNTVILFTSDHGDMLGNHGLWAKPWFYEWSDNVPMILSGVKGCPRVQDHRTDQRLAGLQDVMPTLLDLAGIPIPSSVHGLSLVGEKRREWVYGEFADRPVAAERMVCDGRHKLIYYPCGNRLQLFDLQEDPCELRDLSASISHQHVRAKLIDILISQMYGADTEWVRNGSLVGVPDIETRPGINRGLLNQRGTHWPPPPVTAR
jgi:arylsulfatase A-like enzyme